MEINWVVVGWLIDMTLNGFVWLIISAFSLLILYWAVQPSIEEENEC
tara:strand:+ start:47762 stop:47902 length:141 start_codon:yes stop_codon:yes gene_type:complete